MTNFEIEYSTNIEDRQSIVLEADNKTDAYIKFVVAFPMHYIITNINERV